jgi:predicted transcriptional regulator
MSVTRADVLNAVNCDPHGFTTAELAERMKVPRYCVQTALSKLAAYGLIAKRPAERANAFIWHRKEQQPCAR